MTGPGGGLERSRVEQSEERERNWTMARLLMIDNYDSFTFNLVQVFLTLGAEVIVKRNDEVTMAEAKGMGLSHLVISPGPGHPREAGVSMDMIEHFAGRIPVLGVCLGHQAMAEVFGGKVVRAERLMHGKPSMITHDQFGVFAGLPSPLQVGRYHSLLVRPEDLPKEITVSAKTAEGEIMAIRHSSLACTGVQFHPESVLTPQGPAMLENFLNTQILRGRQDPLTASGALA